MATKRSFDEDTSALEDISVLFIPFDGTLKFEKLNAGTGVWGIRVNVDKDGKAEEKPLKSLKAPPESRPGQIGEPLVPKGEPLTKRDIATRLNEFVKQECELIRNVYNPDSDTNAIFGAIVKAQRSSEQNLEALSERLRSKLDQSVKGYDRYPTIIFLSENAQEERAAFPDRIDTGDAEMPWLNYVRKHKIDKEDRVVHLNEMAVYLREDINKRIDDTMKEEDALYMETETVTRKTKGLIKAGKDEYMLKVTIGRRGGYSFTVAGVHLRATLTAVRSPGELLKERNALRDFCAHEGIQVLVGDFNLDLQAFNEGHRGVYYDAKLVNMPRFLFTYKEDSSGIAQPVTACPAYVQQYSNSGGNRHYMGFFQADQDYLSLVGPSVFGPLGISLSRSLDPRRLDPGSLDEDEYYSDHPSIYFCVESQQLTKQAAAETVGRKIVKAKRRQGSQS